MRRLLILTLLTMMIFISMAKAVEVAPRMSDREIIETLIALREGQKSILREMDKRFEAVDKQFEAVDKRFEDINNRLVSIFIGIVAAFVGLVAVTIGFAIWDRKTTVAPVVQRLEKVERENERIKMALKEIAERNPDLAEILKHAGLL